MKWQLFFLVSIALFLISPGFSTTAVADLYIAAWGWDIEGLVSNTPTGM
jgi:hypothetical protein